MALTPLPPVAVRFVLMRPRISENVGAVARAMKNFSLRQWALVDAEIADPAAAARMAVHAEELLHSVGRHASLDEAISDCVWVVGTSSRHVEGKRRLTPSEIATEAVRRAAEGPVALVFGDERSGLTNAEVQRCHALSAIPTSGEQPSVNLAQAALLYGYELQRARLDLLERPPAPRAAAATDRELAILRDALERLLTRGGFLANDQRHGLRDLLAPLLRSELTLKEARLWVAALQAVAKRLPGEGDGSGRGGRQR